MPCLPYTPSSSPRPPPPPPPPPPPHHHHHTHTHTTPRHATCSVAGLFSVPAAAYPWVLFVLLQVLVPHVSLLGHLTGLLVRCACWGMDALRGHGCACWGDACAWACFCFAC